MIFLFSVIYFFLFSYCSVQFLERCKYHRTVWISKRTEFDINEHQGNFEIIIEINGQKLLEEGKTKLSESDEKNSCGASIFVTACSDIRDCSTPDTEEDDSHIKPMFIENSCNSTKTRIWVDLGNNLEDVSELQLFYNCDWSLTNDKVLNYKSKYIVFWSGRFPKGKCPLEYETFDASFGYFLQGGPDYSLFDPQEDKNHNHIVQEGSTSFNYVSGLKCENPSGSQNNFLNEEDHQHVILEQTTENTEIYPDYVKVRFCQSSVLDIMENTIMMMESAEIPMLYTQEGIEELSEGRFIMSGSEYGLTGGESVHIHSLDFSCESKDAERDFPYPNTQQQFLNGHSHSIHFNTGPADSEPPFQTFVFAKSEKDHNAIRDEMVILALEKPPLGYVEYSNEVYSKFIKGDEFPGETGGGYVHSHQFSGFTTAADGSRRFGEFYDQYGGSRLADAGHYHNFQGVTGSFSSENTLPSISIPMFRRKPQSSISVVMSNEILSLPDDDGAKKKTQIDESGKIALWITIPSICVVLIVALFVGVNVIGVLVWRKMKVKSPEKESSSTMHLVTM